MNFNTWNYKICASCLRCEPVEKLFKKIIETKYSNRIKARLIGILNKECFDQGGFDVVINYVDYDKFRKFLLKCYIKFLESEAIKQTDTKTFLKECFFDFFKLPYNKLSKIVDGLEFKTDIIQAIQKNLKEIAFALHLEFKTKKLKEFYTDFVRPGIIRNFKQLGIESNIQKVAKEYAFFEMFSLDFNRFASELDNTNRETLKQIYNKEFKEYVSTCKTYQNFLRMLKKGVV